MQTKDDLVKLQGLTTISDKELFNGVLLAIAELYDDSWGQWEDPSIELVDELIRRYENKKAALEAAEVALEAKRKECDELRDELQMSDNYQTKSGLEEFKKRFPSS